MNVIVEILFDLLKQMQGVIQNFVTSNLYLLFYNLARWDCLDFSIYYQRRRIIQKDGGPAETLAEMVG